MAGKNRFLQLDRFSIEAPRFFERLMDARYRGVTLDGEDRSGRIEGEGKGDHIGRAMIEHLKGRERALASLGWTGREAEWIAVVCLHSGVFTRAQFCHYFNTQRMTALRFVKALIEQRAAVETDVIAFNGGGKTCRISGKGIYRALGVENIRHRRKANRSVVMRRLLSLDFVLEHPGLNWLPTEAEKVEFIEGLGVHSNLIPRRIYYGAVRAQRRYFALKLPVAGGDKTVTFAYVDPGRESTGELNSWGAAHGQLWDAIRAKGRRVEVIAVGAELDMVLRADRLLQLWAAAGQQARSCGQQRAFLELFQETALRRQDRGLRGVQDQHPLARGVV